MPGGVLWVVLIPRDWSSILSFACVLFCFDFVFQEFSDEEGGASDDDDTSWKVRRSAIKVLKAVIECRSELPEGLYDTWDEPCHASPTVMASLGRQRRHRVMSLSLNNPIISYPSHSNWLILDSPQQSVLNFCFNWSHLFLKIGYIFVRRLLFRNPRPLVPRRKHSPPLNQKLYPKAS